MYPFREGDTSATFRNLVEKATNEIKSLDNEYVLKTSQTELEQYFVEKVLIEPLVLHTDELYIKNQSGTQIDVSHDFRRAVFPGEMAIVKGTKVDSAIPFEGNPMLWQIRASTFSMGGYPEIDIRNNEVVFSISFPDDSAKSKRLRADIDRSIKSLEDAVGYLKRYVDNHNNSAPNTIRQVLARKRELAQSATGAIAALGIPVKRANSQPTFSVPAKRREHPAKWPAVTTGKYEPESILAQLYQKFLKSIKNDGISVTLIL